jgi:AcrR family transcriptional regulator
LVTARFGSKDKLLEALIERIVTGWSYRNVFPRMAGKPGREQIVTFVDAVRTQAKRDPRALRVLYALMLEAIGPIPYLHDRFAGFHRQMRTDLGKILRAGIKDGSIGEIHPEREAELIVAELRGVAYQWALDPDHFDPVPALTYLVSSIDRRLRPARTRTK